eukprot:g3147.t1
MDSPLLPAISVTPLMTTNDAGAKGARKEKGLGTWFGVIQPCLLNIFGAILFLRLPWAVGQAGWCGVILMLGIACTTVVMTTLSIAAISTNGSVRGGGAYFMISRSLGPEFGGAIGLVYYLANCVGVTFYIAALAENLSSVIPSSSNPFSELALATMLLALLFILSLTGARFFLKANSLVFLVLIISILACIGSMAFKLNPSMALLEQNLWTPAGPNYQCACVAEQCGRPHESACEWEIDACAMQKRNASNSTLVVIDPIDGETCGGVHLDDVAGGETYAGFFAVFIVIFPAVTGIMAGANYSGDLADPGKSIGRGTLAAIAFSIVIYAVLSVQMGSTMENKDLRDVDIAKTILQRMAWPSPGIVVAGIVASTWSSALGALVGSARVLQAVARDKIIPGASIFAYGAPGSDEPRIALVLSIILAQAFLFIGSLNVISALISNFFLLVYFFLNLACFVLRVSAAPNFRPTFRYFSWHTALLGALLSLGIMIVSSPVYAGAAVIIVFGLAIVIHYFKPPVNWGDVSQGLIYHQVRKYLLKLDVRKTHPKFWRPSLLAVIDCAPRSALNLLDFCNDLKKGGLFIVATPAVSTADTETPLLLEQCIELREAWNDYIEQARLKAFAEVSSGPSARIALGNLFVTAGLGGMRPNTIVMQFFQPNHSQQQASPRQPRRSPFHQAQASELEQRCCASLKRMDNVVAGLSTQFRDEKEYISSLQDIVLIKKHLIVARFFDDLDKELVVAYSRRARHSRGASKMRIDVWAFASASDPEWDRIIGGRLALQLQLAHIASRAGVWFTHCCIRASILLILPQETSASDAEMAKKNVAERLENLLQTTRVQVSEMNVIVLEEGVEEQGGRKLLFGASPTKVHETILSKSASTALMFLPMPPLPPQNASLSECKAYIDVLHHYTRELPPSMMVTAVDQATMTTEL